MTTLIDDQGRFEATPVICTTAESVQRDAPPAIHAVAEKNSLSFQIDVSGYNVRNNKNPTSLLSSRKECDQRTVNIGEVDVLNTFID